MSRLYTAIEWCVFALLAVVVLGAPWLFGAWEMWWFRPFMTALWAALFLSAVRLVLAGRPTVPMNVLPRSALIAAIGYGAFLVYCIARAVSSTVFMDAERSILLLLSPAIIAVTVMTSLKPLHINVLFGAIMADLFALGLYGILNHHYTGSEFVMWVKTEFTQYAGRATGSYFCPDHFSGAMELLLAAALGLITGLDRIWVSWSAHDVADASDATSSAQPDGRRPRRRSRRHHRHLTAWRIIGLAMTLVAAWGIVLSQSRGGGLTFIVVCAAAAMMTTMRMPFKTRWIVRLSGIALLAAGLAVFLASNSTFAGRFKEYVNPNIVQGAVPDPVVERIAIAVKSDARYNMYSAAIRAWQASPVWGIGAGMHQHVWPSVAASPDGDRATGRWPSRPNSDRYSYEVHSDWLQLLEEYGVVGFLLLAIPAMALLVMLIRGTSERPSAMMISSLLSFAVMAFHSLGDFNLQIPANTWLFSALLMIGPARAAWDSSRDADQ